MKSKILPLFVVACFSPTLLADTISWTGTTTGDWTTPANWSNNTAPAAGNAYAATGTGKTVNSPATGNVTFAGDSLAVANGSALKLITTNGGGTLVSTFTIPNLTLDGATVSPASSLGSVTQTLANQLALANAVTVEMNDAGGFTNGLTFNNGYVGSGSLTIKRGGTTGSSRNVVIGGTNSTAAYSGAVSVTGNSSGKTVAVTINPGTGWGGGNLTIGQWSSVTLGADTTGTGGVTVAANGTLQIGNAAGTGSLAKDILNNGSVAFNRTGTLVHGGIISGTGSVSLNGTGSIVLTGANTHTGGTTLNSGMLVLGGADAIGSTGNLTLKGGTLQFSPSNKTDYSSRIHIADTSGSGASVTLDTTSRSVVFANPLTIDATGTVTLTKTGIGTLTLEGANTYTGATTVNAGTLKLNGSLASPITVASGATLTGGGSTTGSLTLSSGSSLLVGNSHITASGVSAAAVTLLPDAASVVPGTNLFTVVGYNGAGTPMVSEFSTAGFRNGFIADDAGNFAILFQFDAAARTWGGVTGTWDLGGSASWTGGDNLFFNGDTATFGDITADNLVTLTGTLAPAAVTIANNTTFGYTFSGTGSIAGNTALSKTGPGPLVVSTSNTYTGGTTLNGGTTTATAANALGTGPVTITSGTIALDGGTLPNTISGTGDILATGTSQGTLSGNLSGLTGTATVSTTAGGKLAITGATVAPTTLPVTLSSGATLYAANGATIAGTISVTGTGNTEGLGAIRLDTGATASGAITLNNDSTIGSNSGTGTISGAIGEAGGARALTKVGSGTVMLSGANTFTGIMNLSGGTLLLGASNTLATVSKLNFTTTGSTLDIGSTSPTFPILTANSVGTSSVTHNVKGTGTLTVNGASDLLIQNPGSSSLGTTLTMDMSGLANLVYNRSSNSVIITGTGNNRPVTATLANNTTITAANFHIQNDSSGNNTAHTATVNLGNTTTLNVNNLNLLNNASSRDNATLRFRSGGVNPTLVIRAADGTGRANIKVGASSTVTNSGVQTGAVDLLTGVSGTSKLDALVGTLSIGDGRNTSASTYSFIMGSGTLDATALIVGNKNGVAGTPNANFSVTGGTVKATTVTLGVVASGGTGVNSTLTLNGSSVLAAQTIATGTGAGTRTFSWNSGTITTLDASTDLTVSSALKLAATGNHVFDIGTGRTGTVSGIISEAAAGGVLTKAGAGTLVLSGVNTYTGDTLVTGGTLTLSNAFLADTADVKLSNGAVLNLNHAATDTVDELYIDGVQQAPGTWGSLTSSATHKTARITGTGLLQVTTGASASSYSTWAATNAGGQPADGDFDSDGVKNGVEYFFGATPGFTANPATVNGTITWPKDATAAATPIVETSADLITWTPVTFTDNGTSIQYTIPTGDPKRFVRLRVTVP
ncbi:autotransporter-associated beta strand repeat-containing protein [Luteolibacter ambystomatis]|uniref:Autotransporter-associated beta strand repeat-containing protein n=1 Tax=Luteolibacter ambystomatis TaxID=2824561 RepID=A0A975J2N9_9BACT|nr:autotransporter-associated beta strand repeat-containing protein [Luteolibacter ambystomatis]QUE52851.1 autotransporter-associated beta strand repeat-containing protein [Luteolibacter ambystomatis]